MCAKWKNNNCDIIIKKINSCERKITSDGKVSLSINGLWDFTDYGSIIGSNINFKTSIAIFQRDRLVHNAIFAAAKDTWPLTKQDLIAKISSAENAYHKKPEQVFTILKQVQLHSDQKIKQAKINGYTFLFSNNLPLKYKKEISKHKSQQFYGKITLPQKYKWVKVQIKTKNIETALDDAIYHFNLLGGIWNLFLIQGVKYYFGVSHKPVGETLDGPITYAFLPDSKLAKIYSYEPDYRGELDISKYTNDKWRDLLKFQRVTLNKLKLLEKKSPSVKRFIEKEIVSFREATSLNNQDLCLIQLWAIMERIARVAPGTSHYKITERLSSLFLEPDFVKTKMEYIMQARHCLAHGDAANDSNKASIIQMLKNFCLNLLLYFIDVGDLFENIEEWEHFLDCKCKLKDLKDKVTKYNFHRTIFKHSKEINSLISGK
jgi:hypothetical protein